MATKTRWDKVQDFVEKCKTPSGERTKAVMRTISTLGGTLIVMVYGFGKIVDIITANSDNLDSDHLFYLLIFLTGILAVLYFINRPKNEKSYSNVQSNKRAKQ